MEIQSFQRFGDPGIDRRTADRPLSSTERQTGDKKEVKYTMLRQEIDKPVVDTQKIIYKNHYDKRF